jgi:NitT/TauT family transport system substrate-binding protein
MTIDARTLTRRSALALGAAALATPALGQAALPPVRVGVLRLASAGPVFIAQDKGYTRDAGVDVTLRFFDAAQPIAVAIASGDIDVGITAFTGGLFNLAGRGQLKVLAAQSREEPGFPLIAYLASKRAHDAGLRTLRDLRGKSVGITQVGSSFHYSLGLITRKLGFPMSDVRMQPLQSLSNLSAALIGGSIEAALLPSTVARPLIDRGEAVLLGWVSDETPWQVGALFAGTRFIQQQRDPLTRYIAAYRKAAAEYHDVLLKRKADGTFDHGPEAAALIEIIARNVNQSAAIVTASLAFVDREARLDWASVADQLQWYQENGFVDRGFGMDAIMDTSFVPPIRR